MHAPRSPAFSPCLREIVRRPMRAYLHATCLFSNLLFPCYSFHVVSRIWPHVNLPFSVQPGLAALPSRAVLLSDLPEHTWSLSFIWSASCIAGHCELSCNCCVFLSNEIMHLWEMMMPLHTLWPQYLVGFQWQLADRGMKHCGEVCGSRMSWHDVLPW